MKITKYGASSSIIILDYDVNMQKFRVIKRIEVTRGEYSYDNAVNTIVELNEIYKPAFIYCDAGSGEYQIERLHIIGDEQPHTGLKNKVKRWQFSESIEITDPITYETVKEPVKQIIVNQLTLSFERDRLILSPFDEVLPKQLLKYEVVRRSANGKPVFSSEDEHFIDALGLAHLAFVLEFKDLTKTIKDVTISSMIQFSDKSLNQSGLNKMFNEIQQSYSSSKATAQIVEDDDLPGDKPKWIEVSRNYRSGGSSRFGGSSWGSRSGYGGGSFGRTLW